MTPAFAFSFVLPFLVLMALTLRILMLLGKNPKGWASFLLIAAISGGLVLLPINGLPGGRWLISFFPNPSIPLTALFFLWIIEKAFEIRLLDDGTLGACWLVSLLSGVVLFPMALGAGPWDPYGAGWHFSWLFVLLFGISLYLLYLRNRFSVVLVATILAYDFQLLESSNLWDYLVDPVLVLVAIGALTLKSISYTFGKKGDPLESRSNDKIQGWISKSLTRNNQ